MKKNNVKATKTYPVEIFFEVGEDACPYEFELTDKQVRMFWENATGETIPCDIEIHKVVKTERDWHYVADSAAEFLFNYICDNKKLNALLDEACK